MARLRALPCLVLWLAVAGAEPVAFTGVNLAGGEFFTPQPNVRPVYGRNFTYPLW